jgi:uncharacterized membrane protein YhaH (DUF805 family)
VEKDSAFSDEQLSDLKRLYPKQKVCFKAEAVRELYGDREPTADDGILGWVPGIKEQLAAEDDEIELSLIDWNTHAIPDDVVAKLHGSMRIKSNETNHFDPEPIRESERSTSVVDQGRISTSKKIIGVLSNTATIILGLVVMIGLTAIPVVLVYWGGWAAPKILEYMVWPVQISFVLCVLIFLPLSLFRTTRFISAIGFMISSYIFGASTWFAGLLALYISFGTVATVIALCFFAIGVVPLGIIGAIIHKEWMAAGILFGSLVLTYGTRVMGAWMAALAEAAPKADKRHQPDGFAIRALKFCFSFFGRFNRKNFWIGYGIGFAMSTIPMAIIETISPDNSILELIGAFWGILWFVSSQAIAAKRLHDLGYSGLWLLAYFAIFFAGSLVLRRSHPEIDVGLLSLMGVIWLGAMPSQKGFNRFGPEPTRLITQSPPPTEQSAAARYPLAT